MTAGQVRWIFARRLAGTSAAGIARTLNERGIPSPGVYDRERNRHRNTTVWTLRTVAAILANPRYTGRQVWNRQFTDHREAVPDNKRSSRGPVRSWTPRTDWVISRERTHPPLVSDADFLTVQKITALAMTRDGRVRRYALTGLLVCGVCGRRLEGHWVNQRPGYRCRHGHTTAHPPDQQRPRWVYWAQARIVDEVHATNRSRMGSSTDAGQLANHLRARDAVIVCHPDTVTIEEPGSENAGAAAPKEAHCNGQLLLPIPAVHRQRPKPTRTSRPGQETQDPHRYP